MTRSHLFDKEPVQGLSGLVGLTAPDGEVAMVIDAVVLGAKGDGKTQLITHAIRTLDARGPAGLSPDEQLQNEKMLALVLNAKRPQPEANPDRKVRHYVVRAKAESLVRGLAAGARAALLVRSGRATRYLVAVALGLLVVVAALRALRGELDVMVAAGAAAAALGGVAWALHAARRDFVRAGEVEIVFWDVAGEDVYSDRGAASYHAFLGALVARRRARGEPHALAPILICNPIGVGRHGDDSPYARLRMILPSFAALGRPQPDVLVVVNRWDLAQTLCRARVEADECVAIVPIARDAGAADGAPAAETLPVVRRQVALRHCLDGEPDVVGTTRFRMVRYEAGLDTRTDEKPWPGWEALPPDVRARWREPEGPIAQLVEYRYAEGPGVLGPAAAAGFFDWLAQVAWPGGRAAEPEAQQPQPLPQPEPEPEGTMKMFAAQEVTDKRGGFRSGS